MKSTIPIIFMCLYCISTAFAQQITADNSFFSNGRVTYDPNPNLGTESVGVGNHVVIDENVSFFNVSRSDAFSIFSNRMIKVDNNNQGTSPQVWYTFSNSSPLVDYTSHSSQGLLTVQTSDSSIILSMLDTGSSNTLVSSFGSSGVSSIALPSNNGNAKIYKVLENTDGSFLLIGAIFLLNQNDSFLVAKVNANGTLDTNFGTNGFFTTSTNTVANVQPGVLGMDAVLLQDNRITVVVSYQVLDSNFSPPETFYYGLMFRVMPNGTIDNSLTSSPNSIKFFNFGQSSNLVSTIANIELLSDNSLFVFGTTRTSSTSNSALCITKLDSTGNLESWVASGGASGGSKLITNFGLGSVSALDGNVSVGKGKVHTDGRLYIGGNISETGNRLEAIFVVNSDGSINTNVDSIGAFRINRIANPSFGMEIVNGKIILFSADEISPPDNYPLRTSRFNLSLNTNIRTTQNMIDLSIFPNPTPDLLQIQTKDVEVKDLSVFDLNGRHIRSFNQPNNTVDLGFLPNGTYFILVETNQGWYSEKIQILK